jgi:hypothetical protein
MYPRGVACASCCTASACLHPSSFEAYPFHLFLDSDDALSVSFQQGYPSGQYTGTIELVPEPALALMQGLALLSVAVIRSRRCASR